MLALICIIPILSFTLLALLGSRLHRLAGAVIGCMSIALSGILTFFATTQMLQTGSPLIESWGPWIQQAGHAVTEFSFRLDALSATMAGIVCFVGFLIHYYATEYMQDDAGRNRFFAYMNLFIGSMLLLVMADDMLLLFLGWEGVGLCSYLLIGFWYQERYNVACAEKAFYLTRIGDVAFMIALFLVFAHFGTWNIPTTHVMADTAWMPGSGPATLLALLLLIAAVAKSAQLPLHVWLPDAMAGPTPVSALLHSSTMVTAGVYLIARMHPFFLLAPNIMHGVAVIGAVTAFYAGFTALSQTDIKRILAYSSISQIGYMFLGLGVGAFEAAMFHFVTHAFFKSLLFLGAGAVSHAADGERNILKLGGLRRALPVTFWTFVAGAAALAALPLVTSGFYSKDAILWGAFASHARELWWIGVAAALLTGWYATRLVVYTFLGPERAGHPHRPGWRMRLPMMILALLALTAGFMETPPTLGHIQWWHHWIEPVFAAVSPLHGSPSQEAITQLIASIASLLGIGLGFWFAWYRRDWVQNWIQRSWGRLCYRLSLTGCYVDLVYQSVFVKGFENFIALLRPEWVDTVVEQGLKGVRGANQVLSASQTGRVRWYVTGLIVGVIILGVGALSLL